MRHALASALRTISYEVLPFKDTEEQVVAHVPRDVPLTVTTTEAKGLEPTLDLAVRLARQGYRAAPHVAARLVRDDAHLADIVQRLQEAGVDGVFVVGGDAREPAGRFTDAVELLGALEAMGHPFQRVGITGYPEGHGHLADRLIEDALVRKAPHATLSITQLCFSAGTTIAWARAWHAGVVNATGDAAPDAWRRVVPLMIQSFEAPARGPLPDSPEPDALYQAMLRASQAYSTPQEPGKGS